MRPIILRPITFPGMALLAGVALVGLGACTPTVKVEVPDKPIEINLNIHIQQDVRVRVERDLDKAIANDPALFGLPPESTGGPSASKGSKSP